MACMTALKNGSVYIMATLNTDANVHRVGIQRDNQSRDGPRRPDRRAAAIDRRATGQPTGPLLPDGGHPGAAAVARTASVGPAGRALSAIHQQQVNLTTRRDPTNDQRLPAVPADADADGVAGRA